MVKEITRIEKVDKRSPKIHNLLLDLWFIAKTLNLYASTPKSFAFTLPFENFQISTNYPEGTISKEI